jgi:hypothetical protein
MSFRQDSDPGSVKSLLALLRSNQDASTSNNNNAAGGSATATPPPAPPAANDPYSLASNPFHQATYGHLGSSAGTSNGHQHQHQPERAHAHGYDYGYQNQNQPGPAQTGGSSLQDLLATLRRNNTDSFTPRPSGSAQRETQSHPTLTGTERREREREEDRPQSQASGSKRRRIEREVDRKVEVEVDPYAEEDQHRGPERGYEYDSYEGNGTDDRDYDHDLDRPARIPQPEHVVQVEDPPQSAAIDLSANPDNDNEVEEEEDNQMNRYGYTPEQMSNLSIEEGKPIVDELITRGDVVEKLKKVRLTPIPLSLLRPRCRGRLHPTGNRAEEANDLSSLPGTRNR